MYNGSVIIGFSVYRDFHWKTVASIIRLQAAMMGNGCPAGFLFERGCYIHQNRERLCQAAIRKEAEYLVFIDSDVSFTPDVIERLVAHGKDIVGAAYNARDIDPPQTVVRCWHGPENLVAWSGENKSIFKCAAVPGGMMCIKTSCLAKMQAPYFRFDESYGDDVGFCVQAQRASLEVWCDPTLSVKHMGDKEY